MVPDLSSTPIPHGLIEFAGSSAQGRAGFADPNAQVWAAALAAAYDTFLLLNAEHQVYAFNARALASYGYAPAELEGMPLKDLRSPRARSDLLGQMQRALREGGLIFETEHQKKDGTLLPVEVSTRPVWLHERLYYVHLIRDLTTRKRAETERDQFFRLSLDLLVVMDMEHRIKQLNPAWETLLGWPLERLQDQPITALIHPDDTSLVLAAWRSPAEGELQPAECRMLCKSGAYRWVAWNASQLPAERRMYAVGRDFTDKRQVQSQLAYQALLLQNISDAVIGTDEHMNVTAWNYAAEDLYGFRAEQALGRSSYELLESEMSAEERAAMLRQAAATGRSRYEVVQHTRDGRRIVVEGTSIVLRDPLDRISGYVAVNRDITERKNTEQKLRESEARFRLALKGSATVVFTHDRELKYTWVYNPSRGLTVEEIVGRTDEELVPGESGERLMAIKRRVLQSGIGTRLEYPLDGPQGRQWYDLSIEPLRDSAGEIAGLTCVSVEITEYKRAEERQHILARVGDLVAHTVHLDKTLQAMTHLILPEFADWCELDLLDGRGELELRAVAHRDPSQEPLVRRLRERMHSRTGAAPFEGSLRALQTGEPVWRETVPSPMQMLGVSIDSTELIRELSPCSYIVTPLKIHGEIVGELYFVMSVSGRHYRQADVAVADEVARRCALAIENAQLHERTERLNRELEGRVQQRTAELRQAIEQLHQLARHNQTVQEEERERIAGELHDDLGQLLTILKIDLTMAAQSLPPGGDVSLTAQALSSLKGDLANLTATVDQAVDAMREIVRDLRADFITNLGLHEALTAHLDDFQARTGLDCNLAYTVEHKLPPERAMALYRICQEALTNVARHAHATQVDIKLKEDPVADVLIVADNGRGFNPEDLAKENHFGVLGMRERVLHFDGTFDITGAPGAGCRVEARLPRRHL